ncbi:MAG: S41 family peptidase [Bacteroidota bacterium]
MNESSFSRLLTWLLAGCLFGLLTSATAQKRLSLSEAQADVDTLVEALQQQHQGLYLHLDRPTTDHRLDSIRASLRPNLSRIEFFKTVQAVLALTNEGHSHASLPKSSRLRLGTAKGFMPIAVRFYERNAYLMQYFGEEKVTLERGIEILSINGQEMGSIVEEALRYIPTDGFNQTSAYEWLGWQFPILYRLGFGPADQFELIIRRPGEEKTERLTLSAVRASRLKGKHSRLKTPVLRIPRLALEQINDSVAYLAINSFSLSPKEYGPWLQQQFTTIRNKGIRHLILDVQQNGGGSEGNENLLMAYLEKEPFQKYAFVSMPITAYTPRKDQKGLLFDQWSIKDGIAQRGAFTLQSAYFSELGYEAPADSLVFPGKVYLLTSGVTFSGGAEFTSMFRMRKRGLVIGEECGGVYEGNVSGYSTSLRLPHSRISVDIPIVYFRINVQPNPASRGVLPDHVVPQTVADYLQQRNSKREFVVEHLLSNP